MHFVMAGLRSGHLPFLPPCCKRWHLCCKRWRPTDLSGVLRLSDSLPQETAVDRAWVLLGTGGGEALMRPPEPADGSDKSLASTLTSVALLWLAGNGMRMTILAVPPLIPLIHHDLHMSETEVGILAG